MREQIKKIVIEEFSNLTELIEADFSSNYRRKVNNFLLMMPHAYVREVTHHEN